MIENPVAVGAVLFCVLAAIFWANSHPQLKNIFKVIPLIVFAYFVPTLLSNTGILPLESPAYDFIKKTLLPASLLLLILSVDIPAVMKLGPKALIMFFGATLSVLLGSALSFLSVGWLVPPEMREQTWKGLAALCGSWIGGAANFVAVGESVGAHQSTLGLMVIVDVAVASVWMAILFYFAGKEKELDSKIGAETTAIDALREKVETYKAEVSRPTTLSDLLMLGALSIGSTALCTWVASLLPNIGDIISGFTWVVILITAVGVSLSFTGARKLEGAGASALGSAFLYLLVSVIGAQGNFREIVNAPVLVLIGAVWMLIHAVCMLVLRRAIKAPMFFLAVGSQANIGAAASAPIVASAFHPSLATVGVLLAILGYVLGTYLAIVNAFVLEFIYNTFYALPAAGL